MKKLLNVTWTYSFRKKHRFKDSKTKERFFIKKPLWNMKKYQSRHEKQQSNLQKNQLTCSLVGSNCLNDNKVATPLQNVSSRRRKQRAKKLLNWNWRHFSRRILSGYSTALGDLGNNYFFTVKVNKSLNIFEIVEMLELLIIRILYLVKI